jgi:replicative DNA helicase
MMGKSTLALNIATNIAEQNIPVMIFNFESDKDMLLNRTGNLSNIYICRPSIYIGRICKKIKEMKAKKDIQFVLIDYLQCIRYDGDEILGRGTQITRICEILKELAEELNITILLVSAISMSVNDRQEPRPILEDINTSGKISQVADVVMLLYREDYYDKNCEVPNLAELIIAKNKNDNIKTVFLVWIIPPYNKYVALQSGE